jgi:hypothetical protein
MLTLPNHVYSTRHKSTKQVKMSGYLSLLICINLSTYILICPINAKRNDCRTTFIVQIALKCLSKKNELKFFMFKQKKIFNVEVSLTLFYTTGTNENLLCEGKYLPKDFQKQDPNLFSVKLCLENESARVRIK